MVPIVDNTSNSTWNKTWDKSAQQVQSNNAIAYGDAEIDNYNPILNATLSGVSAVAYLPLKVGEQEPIEKCIIPQEDREYLSQYINVDDLQQAVQAVYTQAAVAMTDVTSNPPKTAADLKAMLNKMNDGATVSFGDVLKILCELMDNMFTFSPELQSLMNTLQSTSKDKLDLSKLMRLLQRDLDSMRVDKMLAQEKEQRENALSAGWWGLGAAIFGVVTAIVSVATCGTGTMAMIVAGIALFGAAWELANQSYKISLLRENVDNNRSDNSDLIAGGLLTKMFGMSPAHVKMVSDITAIITILLSLESVGSSGATMLGHSKFMAAQGYTGISRVLTMEALTNMITIFSGLFTTTQDLSMKIGDLKGDQDLAKLGVMFDARYAGVVFDPIIGYDADPDNKTHTSKGVNPLGRVFGALGDGVHGALDGIDRLFGFNLHTDKVFGPYGEPSSPDAVRMWFGPIGMGVSLYGGNKAQGRWEQWTEAGAKIEHLQAFHDDLKQLQAYSNKLTQFSQLFNIGENVVNTDQLESDNKFQIFLKEKERQSTVLSGDQSSAEIVMQELLKVYQDYMKTLTKTVEELQEAIKRVLNAFDKTTTSSYGALTK
jgi:hypothetical protein